MGPWAPHFFKTPPRPPRNRICPLGRGACFWSPGTFFGPPGRPPRPKTAPILLQAAQDGPMIGPRGPHGAPRSFREALQEGPKRPQSMIFNVFFMFFACSRFQLSDIPRLPKKHRTSPQDGPRGPQEAPKTAQEGPQTAQEAPKTAQEGFKTAPRGAQKGEYEPTTRAFRSKRPSGRPKRPPRGPKSPKRGPPEAQKRPHNGPPGGFKHVFRRPSRGFRWLFIHNPGTVAGWAQGNQEASRGPRRTQECAKIGSQEADTTIV